MVRILLALSLLFVATTAQAAPRWRRTTTTYARPTTSQPVSQYTAAHGATSSGGTGSAQGVADMMASRGVMQHFGNPTGGYEGVGTGQSPEAALGNCCYSNSGMTCVDQGVACGRDGRWYACKRYR